MPAASVSTVAGSAGATGIPDGIGPAARLNSPHGLALSADGTKLYIGDHLAHTVRVMDTATNDVSALAGEHLVEGAADGTGTAAKFRYLQGVAVDGNQLYVADANNHAIRSVDVTTGAVTTVAGTLGTTGTTDATGTSATFTNPSNVYVSGSTLYVSETGSHIIRAIDTGSWAVTTLAGVPNSPANTDGPAASAQFDTPMGMVALGSLLFVADFGNHVIRTIDTLSMTVTTLVGSGTLGSLDGFGSAAQLNYPVSLAIVGSTMYVSDRGNHAIRAVDLSTAEAILYAGQMGSAGVVNGDFFDARFDRPHGLAVYGDTMYVSETVNHDIRAVEIPTTDIPSEPRLPTLPSNRFSPGSCSCHSSPTTLH